MAYDHNKLPAVPMPEGETGKEIQPRGTSRHIIIETDESFSLAPIPADKQELMQWRGRGTFTRAQIAGFAGGYTIELSPWFFEASSPLELGVTVVGATLLFSSMLGPSIRSVRKMGKQKRVIKEALETGGALKLPKKEIGVHLPRTMFQDSVLFHSETGSAEVPAFSLMESIGSQAPGISAVEAADDMIDYRISPGRLAAQALTLLDAQHHDIFLAATRPAMETMHQASQQLLPVGLRPSTPESMKERLVKPATELLLGALATYGVLRAYYAPKLGEQLQKVYATDPEEYRQMVPDIARLNTPTGHNLAWAEVEAFRTQLGV